MLQINEPTPEEIFQNLYCLCGHPIDPEDENGHEDDRCWAADYVGITYTACRCRKVRPIPFEIEIEISEDN